MKPNQRFNSEPNTLRTPYSVLLGVLFSITSLFSWNLCAEDYLYWSATDSSGSYIVRANSNGTNPVNIVEGADKVLGPNGLEYFNGKLFWPDQQLRAVQTANLDGGSVSRFHEDNNPYDVFGTSQLIYWTSQTGNYIDTQLPDGTGYQRFLSAPDVDKPFAIEVTSNYIYWSEVGGQGRIRRSNLDGSDIVTLIPNVFTYDMQVTENYIYFGDNNYPDGALKRANLDGTGIVKLATGLFGGVDLINGICVTDNAIYWSAFYGFSSGIIKRANLDGSSQQDIYISPDGMRLRGVVLVSESTTTPPAPPLFSKPAIGPTGFTFTLTVEAGKTYVIDSSTNLTNWTEWARFTSAGTTENFTFVIPLNGTAGTYFRAWTP